MDEISRIRIFFKVEVKGQMSVLQQSQHTVSQIVCGF